MFKRLKLMHTPIILCSKMSYKLFEHKDCNRSSKNSNLYNCHDKII